MTKEILLEKLDALWDAAEMLPEGTVVNSVSITESYGGEEPRICMRLASGARELAAARSAKVSVAPMGSMDVSFTENGVEIHQFERIL